MQMSSIYSFPAQNINGLGWHRAKAFPKVRLQLIERRNRQGRHPCLQELGVAGVSLATGGCARARHATVMESDALQTLGYHIDEPLDAVELAQDELGGHPASVMAVDAVVADGGG